MHFALPPRKTSSPPPYTRATAKVAANRRRQQLTYLSYAILCILSLYALYGWLSPPTSIHHDDSIPQDSSIVIVTVLDEATMSEDYIKIIKTNRDDYASRHGYKTWYTNITTYTKEIDGAPTSWSMVPALRHAIAVHRDANYVWSLSPHAMITNITLDLYSHIFQPLPSLMLKEVPVVPPDSVIHTYSHLTPSDAYIIISQDMDNLAHTSFLLRNTISIPHSPDQPEDDWTPWLLDFWNDPLFRSYNFQKAENHCLEHLVQWHTSALEKLVLVEQRRINSYNFQYPNSSDEGARNVDSMWREGDLIVNFKGCDESELRDCEKEMRVYFNRWLNEVEKVDGKPPDVELKVSTKDYMKKFSGPP